MLARKLPERSGPSRLFLELTVEDGGRLGRAHVFPGEWYPNGGRNAFSHYFLVLQRAFAGLEAEGREPRLRLQLLKAVNTGDQYPYVVLLKYVVAPEFAVTGGRLEELYRCPLSAFYQHFLGVGRDVLRDARSPTFAAGQALHRGYQRAAQAWVRTRDAGATLAAYDAAVVRAWSDDFAYYLLDRPKRAGDCTRCRSRRGRRSCGGWASAGRTAPCASTRSACSTRPRVAWRAAPTGSRSG